MVRPVDGIFRHTYWKQAHRFQIKIRKMKLSDFDARRF